MDAREKPAIVKEDSSPDVQTPVNTYQSTLEDYGVDKFLLVSFPQIRQVAYCKLPNNVFYPLVLGDVTQPMSVAVDQNHGRFFVADPPNRVIWWYNLQLVDGGRHIRTVGERRAAVENMTAHWISVNSIGDLYFTGTNGLGNKSEISVFRQDAKNLLTGDSFGSELVYGRDNSGPSESPAAYVPSGIAVDAMYLYWGNEIGGVTHGSVVKATRLNIGLKAQAQTLERLSVAVNDVRGMAATGTHIFYTSPQGVYGVPKSASTPTRGGLVVAPLVADTASWNPTNIAWDGDGTLFFTESSSGIVYSFPSSGGLMQELTKHVDAPGAFGLATISFTNAARGLQALQGMFGILPFVLAAVSALLAAAQD